MAASRFRAVVVTSVGILAAALLFAACVPATSQTSATTTTTLVTSGHYKPTNPFIDIPCSSEPASSSLTFEQGQRVACIHVGSILTLNLERPPTGDQWLLSGMLKSTKGDVALVRQRSSYSFVFRGVRPGIDFVRVLKSFLCPNNGCMTGGPPSSESQWAIRVVKSSPLANPTDAATYPAVARISTTACESPSSDPYLFNGMHVIAAFEVSARQLLGSPYDGQGNAYLDRVAKSTLFTECYVQGIGAAGPAGGPPPPGVVLHTPSVTTERAIWVLYRSGALYMQIGGPESMPKVDPSQ
jgi:hypothetical protein